MKLRIFEGSAIHESFFKLDGFPSDDRFLVRYETIEGAADGWIPIFKDSDFIEYHVDMREYPNKKKLRLGWHVTYCDGEGKETGPEVFNGLGGSNENYVEATTNEDSVEFS